MSFYLSICLCVYVHLSVCLSIDRSIDIYIYICRARDTYLDRFPFQSGSRRIQGARYSPDGANWAEVAAMIKEQTTIWTETILVRSPRPESETFFQNTNLVSDVLPTRPRVSDVLLKPRWGCHMFFQTRQDRLPKRRRVLTRSSNNTLRS